MKIIGTKEEINKLNDIIYKFDCIKENIDCEGCILDGSIDCDLIGNPNIEIEYIEGDK